jgi:hypothetical protein
MNNRRFSTFDRTILVAAILCLLIFGYLLYDDHLFMGLFTEHGAVMARLTQRTEDVRLKFATDFHWNNALPGENLYLGDSLFTGAKSGAKVQFTDSSYAEIAQNSLITFSKLDGKYIVTLKQGQILSSAGIDVVSEVPRAPASVEIPRPRITAPKAYSKKVLHLNADNETLKEPPFVDVVWDYDKPLANFVIEYAGDAQFTKTEFTQDTKSHHLMSPRLKEGIHFIRVREDDAMPLDSSVKSPWSNVVQVEVTILHPEINKSLAEVHLRNPYIKKAINHPTPIISEWEPVEGAKAYLIESSAHEDFTDSKKYQLKDHKYVVSDYQPGFIYYRVTAIDEKDAMSELHTTGKIEVVVDPPVLSKTEGRLYWAKSSTEECPPWDFTNRWTSIPTIKNYLIEISQDPLFTDPAIQIKTDKTQYVAKLAKDGKYFWHVKALNTDGTGASSFSAANEFSYDIKQPLPTPALIEPARGMTLFFQKKKNTPFFLTWSSVPNATEYVIEMAADSNFKKSIFSKKLNATKVLMSDSVARGNLYWRVRAVNGDHTSDWSEARKLMVFAGRSATKGQ